MAFLKHYKVEATLVSRKHKRNFAVKVTRTGEPTSLFTRNTENNNNFPHASGYTKVSDHMAEKVLAKSNRNAQYFFAWY
jgi:hypothetical protein